jgi:hypothetical protein
MAAMTRPLATLRLVRPPDESTVADFPRAEYGPTTDGELTVEVLYHRYAAYVGAVASRILGRAIEVDDVVQDVFASAVRSLKRREDPREIKSW